PDHQMGQFRQAHRLARVRRLYEDTAAPRQSGAVRALLCGRRCELADGSKDGLSARLRAKPIELPQRAERLMGFASLNPSYVFCLTAWRQVRGIDKGTAHSREGTAKGQAPNRSAIPGRTLDLRCRYSLQ